MSKIQIVGVYAITQEMQDPFFDLWDGDFAQPRLLADFVQNTANEMVRLDHPTQPYYPNIQDEPDTELWLFAHPQKRDNTNHMIGLFMDVTEQKDGTFKETPRKWLFGRDVTALVIYKKSCCPEFSVMLCGEFEDGFEFTIRDDVLTHDHERNLFANSVAYDADGSELSHAYAHVKSRDSKCNHHHQKPKPKTLKPS